MDIINNAGLMPPSNVTTTNLVSRVQQALDNKIYWRIAIPLFFLGIVPGLLYIVGTKMVHYIVHGRAGSSALHGLKIEDYFNKIG